MHGSPWRIRGDSSELFLAARGDTPVDGAVRLDALAARALLTRLVGVGDLPSPLVAAARHVLARDAVRLGVRTNDPRAVVVAALARGLLVGWRVEVRHRAATGGGADHDADEAPEAGGEHRTKTWIEIELLDMEGAPMRGERYWIKLPDGTVREGALDEHGRAYFGELDAGSAEIHWPDRDGEATEETMPLGQRALDERRGDDGVVENRSRERTWVQIELLDMADQPVPYERYWIKLPDGTVREGALDVMGCAYFDDLDPGNCTIRWLGRDEEAAEFVPDATTPGPLDAVETQVATLVAAAQEGAPFCEECERARRDAEARA